MPLFSSLTPFGQFEFSSEPSEAEKMYNALVASYRDPSTGKPAIDTSEGTHQEAKIYGWALALGNARVTLRRAGNELRPETSYGMLAAHEARFVATPDADDDVVTRRASLAAKQKAARGPRYEAVVEGLQAILGSDFVAYRPMTTTEAEAYPTDIADSPGLFRRHDAIGKSVRLLSAVTRCGELPIDHYSETNQSAGTSLQDTAGMDVSGVGQSFTGNGYPIVSCAFYLKATGSPTGNAVAKIYAHTGTFGTSSAPTGTALATSDPLDVSTLTGSYVLTRFSFPTAQQITLVDGTNYVVTIEYSAGSGGNTVEVGSDSSSPSHDGNGTKYFSSLWNTDTVDYCFYVNEAARQQVSYESWNSNASVEIVPGDILCVDSGSWGLAEHVTVLTASTTAFTAAFAKPHSVGTHATSAPVPLWTNTKRHVLVVAKAASALDARTVRRIHALLTRIMRGPTTWAIVQPTTPGAATVGPFVLGDVSGSPLGAVPLESITL